jgi:hypothetical protein
MPMPTLAPPVRVHSWFVFLDGEDIIRDFAIKLTHAFRMAQNDTEKRILKVRVEEVDQEEKFGSEE